MMTSKDRALAGLDEDIAKNPPALPQTVAARGTSLFGGVAGVAGVQTNDHAGLGVTPADSGGVAGVVAKQDLAELALPADAVRPFFYVLKKAARHEGRDLRAGVWHFGMRAGRGGADATPTLVWVCSPLHVEAVTTDANGSNFGRLLRFRTTLGKWCTWAMPMELLRADGSDLRGELLAMGVEIDPGGHRLLAQYLQDGAPATRIRCVLQTGWASEKVFVLPNAVIGPGAANVAYQSGERASEEYTTAGSLEGWREHVAALAVGNPILMLALCAAFAGPLLARANAESGGLHLVGDSSIGKTIAILVACSTWGGANFPRSWRATANGMEGVAALSNDSLLALDEIGECDPREVGAIVYSLGNGRSKQRASRTGAARPVTRWRCSVLSSGERTIETTMREGGHRIKAGQAMRLLDVPAHRTYGAWDDLHGHASGAALSDALRAACAAHHGHAGPAFLEAITRDDDTDIAQALEEMKALKQFAASDGQEKRAAARFALLAVAGELATLHGITGWQEGQATAAAVQGFAAWKALRGPMAGSLEREQATERVRDFIERHGGARFEPADGAPMVVRDRAGWWRGDGDARRFLFTSEGMHEALKGIDFKRGLDTVGGVRRARNSTGGQREITSFAPGWHARSRLHHQPSQARGCCMSLGVLKGFFERLREPSSATPATPDERGGVAPKPAPVLRCTSATPATPEMRKVEPQSADDTASNPDRDCWPNDTRIGAAMNSAEIAMFVHRHARMLALGLTDDDADKLADRLKLRDREGDDCHACAECRFAGAESCPGNHPLPPAMLHHCAHVQLVWFS